MINFILKKVFGTQNARYIKKVRPIAEKVSALEPEISKLTNEQLRARTDEFRLRLKEKLKEFTDRNPRPDDPIEKEQFEKELKRNEQAALDEILPEAFAVVREAGRRFVNMRHFDVQLIGGLVLHQGKIAEMATGEGKTLVATLAAYLNALLGKGVHIVTVNDYLAKRDRDWMGPIYEGLGLTVGVLQHDMGHEARQEAYGCDITYGTNNEFGFDYLRDNMVTHAEQMVQRGHNFAIVDEVDSILVDEARTPLIISGPAEEATDKYYTAKKIADQLKGKRIVDEKKSSAEKEDDLYKGFDYVANEKNQTIAITEEGELKASRLWGIEGMHTIETMEYRHHIIQALRAKEFYTRDVAYIVKEGEVIIVDEFTGRLMPGRRWSDGLHQAVEAKEGVRIERENQTLATITLQNYFKMYRKLAGMTGTAETEAVEFEKIYNLGVAVIPTNRPLIRANQADVIYKTEKEKFKAVCDEIEGLYKNGRPVLVGTVSIEKNEKLSRLLKQRNIIHNVLNAKYHEMEAHIIAQAGHLGAVTVATNMAGRGTDILLGGNPDFMARDMIAKLKASGKDLSEEEEKNIFQEIRQKTEQDHRKVVELGGLHVLGTERHEARRIDNQLRGRSGRQGDPGSSRFYLSLEDDLMRVFGSDRIAGIMTRLGMEEGQDIQHPLVTRAVATAQKRIEEHNFEIRKHLLEYDNVMSKQREIVYAERRKILYSQDLKDYLEGVIEEVMDFGLDVYFNKNAAAHEWDHAGFSEWLKTKFLVNISDLKIDEMPVDEMREAALERIRGVYAAKENAIGPEGMRELEKVVLLHVIDTKWKDHLYSMDNLRDGIGLRAYGQKDPLVEYQHEGYDMFMDMIDGVKEEALEFLFKVQTVEDQKRKAGVFEALSKQYTHEEKESFKGIEPQREAGNDSAPFSDEKVEPYKREAPKTGRNDPCPCGSGKKYKKCCGA